MQRQASLRRRGDCRAALPSSANHSTWWSTEIITSPRQKSNLVPSSSSTRPTARPTKWPDNVFFASDYIANKKKAAAANATRYRGSRVGGRAHREAKRAVGRAKHATTTAHRPGKTARELRARRPRDNRSLGASNSARMPHTAKRVVGSDDLHEESATRKTEDGEDFLEKAASAVLCLHSRYLGGIIGHEKLVVGLCVLCREAGWMGSSDRELASATHEDKVNMLRPSTSVDPFVVEGLATLGIGEFMGSQRGKGAKHECYDDQRQGEPRADRAVIISFEGFYRILAEIAILMYPHEAKSPNGLRSARAMHRLLLEGAFPLAFKGRTRLWPLRPTVLYGQSALAALHTQRANLQRLFSTYSVNQTPFKSASGHVTRDAFLQMLRDLSNQSNARPVSETHATSVFDAVLQNGQFELGATTCHTTKHQTIIEASARQQYFQDRNVLENSALSLVSATGGSLCWSNFLEAMAALAFTAVEQLRSSGDNLKQQIENKRPSAVAHDVLSPAEANLRRFGRKGCRESSTVKVTARARISLPTTGQYREGLSVRAACMHGTHKNDGERVKTNRCNIAGVSEGKSRNGVHHGNRQRGREIETVIETSQSADPASWNVPSSSTPDSFEKDRRCARRSSARLELTKSCQDNRAPNSHSQSVLSGESCMESTTAHDTQDDSGSVEDFTCAEEELASHAPNQMIRGTDDESSDALLHNDVIPTKNSLSETATTALTQVGRDWTFTPDLSEDMHDVENCRLPVSAVAAAAAAAATVDDTISVSPSLLLGRQLMRMMASDISMPTPSAKDVTTKPSRSNHRVHCKESAEHKLPSLPIENFLDTPTALYLANTVNARTARELGASHTILASGSEQVIEIASPRENAEAHEEPLRSHGRAAYPGCRGEHSASPVFAAGVAMGRGVTPKHPIHKAVLPWKVKHDCYAMLKDRPLFPHGQELDATQDEERRLQRLSMTDEDNVASESHGDRGSMGRAASGAVLLSQERSELPACGEDVGRCAFAQEGEASGLMESAPCHGGSPSAQPHSFPTRLIPEERTMGGVSCSDVGDTGKERSGPDHNEANLMVKQLAGKAGGSHRACFTSPDKLVSGDVSAKTRKTAQNDKVFSHAGNDVDANFDKRFCSQLEADNKKPTSSGQLGTMAHVVVGSHFCKDLTAAAVTDLEGVVSPSVPCREIMVGVVDGERRAVGRQSPHRVGVQGVVGDKRSIIVPVKENRQYARQKSCITEWSEQNGTQPLLSVKESCEKQDRGCETAPRSIKDESKIRRGTIVAKSVSVSDVAMAGDFSVSLFEELLDPAVIHVYSRYRPGLSTLFRRYQWAKIGVGTEGDERENEDHGDGVERDSCCEGPEGYLDDGVIGRLVGDFSALTKMWRGREKELRRLVRASRRRWRRPAASDEQEGCQVEGSTRRLCYASFLEVLARMARTAPGYTPLPQKLMALFAALGVNEGKTKRLREGTVDCLSRTKPAS